MDETIKIIIDLLLDIDLKSADEVFYAMNLLDTALSNANGAFKGAVKEKLDSNEFSEAQKLIEYCQRVENVSNNINCILNYISEKVIKKETAISEANNKISKQEYVKKEVSYSSSVDYTEYETNRYECHNLDEDFIYKRICAFELNDIYQNVKSWKDTLVKLCELLAKEDMGKLKTFINNPDFKGRKNTYFLNEYVPERNNRIADTDIYVWTNLSANDTVKLIKNILKHYNISNSSFIVYLRADYSELHK